MRVKLTNDSFINGDWPDPRIGQIKDVAADFGAHLCAIGVAIEIKVESAPEKKPEPEKPSRASQADPASQRKTAKTSEKKSTK